MSSFVLEQSKVFDEFDKFIPPEASEALRAHITGPQAELHRYSVASEKEDISLGEYDPNLDTVYEWPDLSVGGIVDLDFVKVYLDDALLRYYQDLTGYGDTIAPVANYSNRIITNNANGFKANGTSYPRQSALYDRDVQVGDVAWIRSGASELWTSVADLIATIVAAVVGAATTDANNPATQIAATTDNKTAGADNYIVIDSVDGSTYDGLADGDIDESYTILVVQGSTGNDATTALLRVTSASGRDDSEADFAPEAFDSPTPIGSRGLTVTWTTDNGQTPDAGVDVDDYLVGQTWVVTVDQAFTKPIPTSGGAYGGSELDQTFKYIITVTRGAKYTAATKPQITVTRDDGGDASGPTTVTAAATNVAVGSHGVLIQFSGNELRKGDIYYVPITSKVTGAYKTLVLKNNLTATQIAAADLDLKLYIKKDMEVTENRISDPPNVNWTADDDTITLEAGMEAYDSSLTDSGTPFAVPVEGGTLYAHYRAWVADNAEAVGEISVDSTDVDEITEAVEAVLGTVSPDNPLAYAVFKALQNANGQVVKYTAVADPNVTAKWTDVLDILTGLPDVYSLVPLTYDATIQEAWKDHVEARSTDEVGGEWRVAWFGLQSQSSFVVDETKTSDEEVAKATLSDNPAVSGTQYTLLNCTTLNSQFVTNGVLPGDIVRFLYSLDDFGNPTYSEFVVDEVINEDSLLLESGHTVAVGTAQKFEVWRNAAKQQIADDVADTIGNLVSKRIRFVWPDFITDGDDVVDGYFLAAALAAYTGSVAPHQSIRNLEISGFTAVPRSTSFLNNAQLNTLIEAGCVVVTQDAEDFVYAKAVKTSDQSSFDNGEEVVVRNSDAIKHVLYGRIEKFFGRANVTETSLSVLRTELQSGQEFLKSSTFIDRLGGMITSSDLAQLSAHATIPDRVVVVINAEQPFPLNNANITLVV